MFKPNMMALNTECQLILLDRIEYGNGVYVVVPFENRDRISLVENALMKNREWKRKVWAPTFAELVIIGSGIMAAEGANGISDDLIIQKINAVRFAMMGGAKYGKGFVCHGGEMDRDMILSIANINSVRACSELYNSSGHSIYFQDKALPDPRKYSMIGNK